MSALDHVWNQQDATKPKRGPKCPGCDYEEVFTTEGGTAIRGGAGKFYRQEDSSRDGYGGIRMNRTGPDLPKELIGCPACGICFINVKEPA